MRKIETVLIIIGVIAVLVGFYITVKDYQKNLKICDWCYEKMTERGTLVGNDLPKPYQYHYLCHSNLSMLHTIRKIEQHEAAWIIETTELRNAYRERVKGLVYPE